MDTVIVNTRGLFQHSDRAVNHTCPKPDENGPPIIPLSIGVTFHKLALILCGAFMGIACLLSFFLIMRHALRFSRPNEQRHIIRITFTVPVFAVVAFLSLVADSHAGYLSPLSNLYEAWALCGFLLLLCAWIAPTEAELEAKLAENGKLAMYNRIWFFVFQQPVLMTILFVAEEITKAAGVFCETSSKTQFAHVWINAFKLITTAVAITALLRFHVATKHMTKSQKPLLKLATFKGIVFLNWLQTAIFSFLTSNGSLHASHYLTFHDLSVGIPALIVTFEMLLFSVMFQYAYPVGPYLRNFSNNGDTLPAYSKNGPPRFYGGILGIKALWAAVNMTDLIQGILVAPARFTKGRQMLKEERKPFLSL